MKFMKLGSKPGSFRTDGNNFWYGATELATDIVVNVGDVKFYLHKFPLLSKSAYLQKLVTTPNEKDGDVVHIREIPGGPLAFETCAKFCYGMTITLNAYNVIAVRCAAEYLGMHENVEKGNLIYKIDVFLNASILRGWKDTITVLQTTNSLLPWSEDLKLVTNCVDSIVSKASIDSSKVDWSYTYNRKNLPEKHGNDPSWNGVKTRMVPRDWWVEDMCELEVDLYKRVITGIQNRGVISCEVIGEALNAFALRRLPGFGKGVIQCGDELKTRCIVDMIVWLLPSEKGSVSCSFLLKLLKAAISVDLEETAKSELIRRTGQELEAATVSDLLIRMPKGETTIYNVDVVHKIVEEFVIKDQKNEMECNGFDQTPGILSDASKLMVAKLVNGYLVEIAKDPNLPLSTFIDLAGMVSNFSHPAHDGLYRAIDTYLKEHPGISKCERKNICRLMDCRKLSAEACMHAVQNQRLPLRVVMQVLFFEQARAMASSGSTTPDLPKDIKDLNNGSRRSTRSAVTVNTEDDWDALSMAEEVKTLKMELAALRLTSKSMRIRNCEGNPEKVSIKGLLRSKKAFARFWSKKGEKGGENTGSESSFSLGSANQLEEEEEARSTPFRHLRISVS